MKPMKIIFYIIILILPFTSLMAKPSYITTVKWLKQELERQPPIVIKVEKHITDEYKIDKFTWDKNTITIEIYSINYQLYYNYEIGSHKVLRKAVRGRYRSIFKIDLTKLYNDSVTITSENVKGNTIYYLNLRSKNYFATVEETRCMDRECKTGRTSKSKFQNIKKCIRIKNSNLIHRISNAFKNLIKLKSSPHMFD